MNISVIIPVWNRKQLLQKAIQSVMAQTKLVKELILIDDGSNDDTWQYIEEYTCDIITVVKKRISHCGMPGAVRNRGIESAMYEWIAFLDSDDYWLPYKIEMQANMILKQNTNFCHTREIWMRHGKEISQCKQRHKKDGYVFDDALRKCIIGPSTVLMHKSMVDNYGMFNETLEIAEDYEYWLRITAKENISYVDKACIIKYSGGQMQLSHKYPYIENFRIHVLKTLVHDNVFSLEQQKLEIEELQRKQKIWQNGRSKREV